MLPQPCCAICGKSYGAPYHSRSFFVDGELVAFTYPSMIEMHDVRNRGNGGDKYDLDNNVPLCHECHTRHHSSSPFIFEEIDGVLCADGKPLYVYNEFDQGIASSVDEDVENALGGRAARIRELMSVGASADYYLGQQLNLAVKDLHGDKGALKTWACDEFNISERSFDSWLSKRRAYGSLPEYDEVVSLGITKGYLVARMVNEGNQLESVVNDLLTMPRDQFDATYRIQRDRLLAPCPLDSKHMCARAAKGEA